MEVKIKAYLIELEVIDIEKAYIDIQQLYFQTFNKLLEDRAHLNQGLKDFICLVLNTSNKEEFDMKIKAFIEKRKNI